jgi:protein-arginine kinase activator protein McsA
MRLGYCYHCRAKNDLPYMVVWGLDINSHKDIKMTELCENCLNELKDILKTDLKDNESFENLTEVQLFRQLTKEKNKIKFVMAVEPLVPENYHIFYIDEEQKKKILKILFSFKTVFFYI